MDKSGILSLSNQVENEYLAFLSQVKKLAVLQYPTKASLDFLTKLEVDAQNNLKMIEQARRKVLSLPSVPTNPKLEIDEIKAVRLRLIQSLTPYLDWVNGAQTRKVPWSFIPAAERPI